LFDFLFSSIEPFCLPFEDLFTNIFYTEKVEAGYLAIKVFVAMVEIGALAIKLLSDSN